jgi:hypothetical protein
MLVEQFAGLTAYSRTPAKRVDVEAGKQVEDEIIILEAMTDSLDRVWWSSLRRQLECDLRQREILIRKCRSYRLTAFRAEDYFTSDCCRSTRKAGFTSDRELAAPAFEFCGGLHVAVSFKRRLTSAGSCMWAIGKPPRLPELHPAAASGL